MVYGTVTAFGGHTYLARSSNGRTTGFGPVYLGSSPSLAAST